MMDLDYKELLTLSILAFLYFVLSLSCGYSERYIEQAVLTIIGWVIIVIIIIELRQKKTPKERRC